ncbi:hypothetical protein [Silvimonas amylolytica]|uniref:ATPase n=1 Tax=Silvimonas amylolytica TaxID=449663 RepID=A0ABQ2PIJ9_9NEIS|nr:hypothetical protein [Silvimonas amylolytica]GGP24847.1 hypothetical protein GCM10010971_06660 [Silvimonas amylolytica]
MVWIVLVALMGLLFLKRYWSNHDPRRQERQRNERLWRNLDGALADIEAVLKDTKNPLQRSTERVLRQADQSLKRARLIMDDTREARQTLEQTLLEIGHAVHAIRNLNDALERPTPPAHKEKPVRTTP